MQNAINSTIATEPVRKSRAPLYIVCFFVCLAILDSIFVTLALTTHTGTVTGDAYNRGIAYNETIAAAERQEALGWSSEIALDGQTLSVQVFDQSEQPLEGASVRAILTRPIDHSGEIAIILNETSPGQYREAVTVPKSGQWDIRIFVEWRQHSYQKHKRIIF